MKKKLLICAVLILCLSLLGWGTAAYNTANGTATNVITTDSVQVSLVDGVTSYRILPDSTVSKTVAVKSEEAAAWVRMRYSLEVYRGDEKLNISRDELNQMIRITPDETNWTSVGGWWYCNSAVPKGQTSAPLFTQIHFAPEMGNEYQGTTLKLIITAEAVQKANNGTSVLEAAGWPTT